MERSPTVLEKRASLVRAKKGAGGDYDVRRPKVANYVDFDLSPAQNLGERSSCIWKKGGTQGPGQPQNILYPNRGRSKNLTSTIEGQMQEVPPRRL